AAPHPERLLNGQGVASTLDDHGAGAAHLLGPRDPVGARESALAVRMEEHRAVEIAAVAVPLPFPYLCHRGRQTGRVGHGDHLREDVRCAVYPAGAELTPACCQRYSSSSNGTGSACSAASAGSASNGTDAGAGSDPLPAAPSRPSPLSTRERRCSSTSASGARSWFSVMIDVVPRPRAVQSRRRRSRLPPPVPYLRYAPGHAVEQRSRRTHMTQREYDIVVFGATGFTGGLTAEYLAAHVPEGCRWALAGRNTTKLEAVRERLAAIEPSCADLPLVQADVTDPASLARVAESARVVATTVGPYLEYGEPLVAACAEAGTDYVDLTGEPEFVDRMYLAHHETARRTGARIVHACGFDSIPYDLGVF